MKPENCHIAIITPYAYQPFRSITQLAHLLNDSFRALGCSTSLHTPPGFLGEMTQGSGSLHRFVAAIERISLSPGRLNAQMRRLEESLAKQDKTLFVVLADQGLSSLTMGLGDLKVIQVVNDLIAVREAKGEFGGPKRAFGFRYNQQINLSGLSYASRFLVFSEATKADLLRLAPSISAQNISVTPLINVHPYAPVEEPEALISSQEQLWRRFNLLPQDYILHVGSSAWYKNRMGLVHLMGELKQNNPVVPVLAFAGAAPTAEESSLAQELGLDIYHFAECTNRQLNDLYAGARACVLPSFSEGFCWPALEALSSGCPLVISGTPCLTEHFGQRAAVVLPDPSQMNRADWVADALPYMQELLDADDQLIDELIENGVAHAETFSAQGFQSVLKSLLRE